MCGRFVSSTPVRALAERFLADPGGVEVRDARYNVAPTDEVYVVATTRGARRIGSLSWGLVPRWAAGPRGGPRMINLRAETLAGRPGFREALRRRRCIVPADGFYEWRPGDAGVRQPWLIRGRDGAPLALAGLWDVWRDPAEPGRDPLRSCAILTTAPNALVVRLHDRMPVVLAPEDWAAWLDPAVTDPAELVPLLRPCPDDVLETFPVGTRVNAVHNDGPDLVEPLPPG